MKLRYYLRGLGIGMLVAALVLTISGNTKAKMSDEAVKRRAAELGMVEKDKTVLSDIDKKDTAGSGGNTDLSGQEPLPEPETAKEPDASEEMPEGSASGNVGETASAENTAGQAGDKASAENTAGQTGNASENAGETAADEKQELAQKIEQKAEETADRAEEIAENVPSGRMLTLEVRKGDSSISVARRAAEIGLITSAADFDVFLCRNGYDRRISTGTYTIAEGSSEQYIAEVITKSR